MSNSTDHTESPYGLEQTGPLVRNRRRARSRDAESWIDEDVDFSVSQRSRTIVIVSKPSPTPEPASEATHKPRTALRDRLRAAARPSITARPKDLLHDTAHEIDRAAGVVTHVVKDVATHGAHKARSGAHRVNHIRRAGLPPAREPRNERPRLAAPDTGRRPRRKAAERFGSHPDRIVLWAVALGIFLILIAATSSSQAATPKLGSRVLSIGSSGHDVRILHRKLKTEGFYARKVSSRFTKTTRTGVRKYQKSRCMNVDGVVGPSTAKAIRTRKPSCLAKTSGGTPPTPPPAAGPDLGARTLSSGDSGTDVRLLQKLLNIAQTSTYDAATVAAVKSFQGRVALGADGVAGPQTLTALGNSMPTSGATWYGPGLYGNTTACGQTLAVGIVGVAHKTLPCGTEVIVALNGKFKAATVIDRGPYTDDASWDLTEATAQSIGLLVTGPIHASVPG
ncbi:MAG TPA: peptidoglycan-binding protein [Baekduia sp.]|nr:peptidoglycan-binding protein [Baekduia sp.]